MSPIIDIRTLRSIIPTLIQTIRRVSVIVPDTNPLPDQLVGEIGEHDDRSLSGRLLSAGRRIPLVLRRQEGAPPGFVLFRSEEPEPLPANLVHLAVHLILPSWLSTLREYILDASDSCECYPQEDRLPDLQRPYVSIYPLGVQVIVELSQPLLEEGPAPSLTQEELDDFFT